MSTGCQFIGPEQDPHRDYPLKQCGAPVIEGKSYCHDHYWRVYQKGSAVAGRRKEKVIEQEINELKRLQELDLENEDV
jgi:hypothetical protein